MAGAYDCDGRRQASFSVSGLARSGRPMPIPISCFRTDCRCKSNPRFRSRGCRLFRFRSAARHLRADRVPAFTTAGEAAVSSGGSGDAYNTMMAQGWGSQAADAAAAMGVSATALAATCVMESNCQNVGAASGSSATGAFQMINSTYTADISGAVAYDPAIAGSIVSGLAGQMDPTTEAYAASYELRTDAMMLQTQENMSNPTVLAVRAVYQFGAGVGPDVAAADNSENIAQLTGLSAASLAANGLSSSSTVGQWRATIIAKLGSATANQSVFAQ